MASFTNPDISFLVQEVNKLNSSVSRQEIEIKILKAKILALERYEETRSEVEGLSKTNREALLQTNANFIHDQEKTMREKMMAEQKKCERFLHTEESVVTEKSDQSDKLGNQSDLNTFKVLFPINEIPQGEKSTSVHEQMEVMENIHEVQDLCTTALTTRPTRLDARPQTPDGVKKHGFAIREKNDGREYWLCICGDRFKSSNGLHSHMKIFKEGWNLKCVFCIHPFYHLTKLKEHLCQVHHIQNPLYDVVERCSKCGMMFTKSRDHHLHRLSCGYVVASVSAPGPLQQSTANNSSGTDQVINGMQVVDNKEHFWIKKPGSSLSSYSCRCGLVFTRKANLSVHVLTKVFGKIYTCNTCLNSFTRVDYLKQHSIENHGQICSSFMCKFCLLVFQHPLDLNQHLWDCHTK